MFTNLLAAKRQASGAGAILMVAALLLLSAESRADSGFYLGGSVGTAVVEIDTGTPVNPVIFDEDDFAWKAFAGYNFDLPIIDLGIEAGYVNLGSPSADIGGIQFAVDTDGFEAFGLLGVNLGPVGVFAKAGVIAWDAEFTVDGVTGTDDGTDPAYGIGAKIGLGSLAFRLEFELFDIEDTEDVAMVSAGVVWTF